MSILNKIIEDKKLDLKNKGYTYGIKIPDKRRVPIVPLTRSPIIICEIKRSSPSKGIIKADIDPVKQTAEYVKRGVKSVSVLTEERYFSGSLRDLILVKEAFPDISILRKDFIISEEEVDISYRAGADAVLLIASIHTNEELYRLYRRAKRYRMDVLFEIHSEKDIEKANRIKPDIVGINSRKLDDFTIDLFHPLKIKRLITWKHTSIFESGIKNRENAVFALSSGFDGMLIGEAVVKNPDLIKELKEINKAYRVLPSRHHGLILSEITKEEAKFKLCKIMNITTIRGGHLQFNLHDGRNIRVEIDNPKEKPAIPYKTGGTLKISLPDQQILDYFPLQEGNQSLIYQGKNIGIAGEIKELTKRFGVNASLAIISGENGEISTSYDYVFIIGDNKPAIDLPLEE